MSCHIMFCHVYQFLCILHVTCKPRISFSTNNIFQQQNILFLRLATWTSTQQVFRFFSTLSLLTCSTDVGRDNFSCRNDRKSVIRFVMLFWFSSPVAQIFCPCIYETSCLFECWNMWCFDQTDAHINAVQKFKLWSRNCVIILTPVF